MCVTAFTMSPVPASPFVRIIAASWISTILSGSAMRATPPSARMSAGTRSSAMTATAPASSAMRACSAVVTSMITPPLSISASPLLTRIVPISAIAAILASALEAAEDLVHLFLRRRDRPQQDGVLLRAHHVIDVRPHLLRREAPVAVLDADGVVVVGAEGDAHGVARMECHEPTVGRVRLHQPELGRSGRDAVTQLAQA